MSGRARHMLRAAGLVAVLLGLEAAGVAALICGQGMLQGLGFALGHGAASAAATALWFFLPRVYQRGPEPRRKVPGQDAPAAPDRGRRRARGAAVLFTVALFLPGFGVLGLVGAVLPALHRPITKRERDWRRTRIPPLPSTLFDPHARSSPVAGGTSLMDIIESPDTGADQRLAAVLAMRQLPTRAAVPALRVALRDAVDDVRLLAYSMLDRRDGALQARIQRYESALARGDLAGDDAVALRYSLAQLYWELVYTGLAAGAVGERALDSAAGHARAVLEQTDRPSAAGAQGHAQAGAQGETGAGSRPCVEISTLFLLGRILLRQGEIDGAERVFEQARERGFADASIRPFLAEIAFVRRDIPAVKAHLRALGESARRRPGLVADLCRFWLPEEA